MGAGASTAPKRRTRTAADGSKRYVKPTRCIRLDDARMLVVYKTRASITTVSPEHARVRQYHAEVGIPETFRGTLVENDHELSSARKNPVVGLDLSGSGSLDYVMVASQDRSSYKYAARPSQVPFTFFEATSTRGARDPEEAPQSDFA